MKNLHKWRKKEIGYVVLCLILVLMPIAVMLLINTFFSELLTQGNTSAIAIICMVVFWAVAVFVLSKHFQKMVIVDAMCKNEKRLRTDRRFYPSNRQEVSAEEICTDLSPLGFTITEAEPKLAKKGRCGLWIVEGCESYEQFLAQKKAELDAEYHGKKPLSYAVIFLCSGVSAREQELSRDVVALNAGCLMPVFYDMGERKAYFMGGDAGKGSDEAPVQKIIKDIVLNHPEPFGEKTQADKTEEENKFDELDLDVIFNEVNNALASDRDCIDKMSDGEISINIADGIGAVYYKKDGRGIAHPFKVDKQNDKKLILQSLEIACYCAPKAAAVRGQKLYEFKDIMEKYLTDNGYEFSYEGEKK